MKPGTTVCTACVYPNKREIAPFLLSCERFGIDGKVFGLGEAYKGYVHTKMFRFRKFLDSVNTTRVLYIDGTDTLWAFGLASADAAYERISTRQGRPVVIGAEWWLYPYPGRGEVFQRRAKAFGAPSPFIYHMPGVVMGETQAVREMFDKLIVLWEHRHGKIDGKRLVDDDMTYWQLAICEGLIDPAIDYDCELTVTLGTCRPDMYTIREGTFRCEWTGSDPVILHFNRLRRPIVKQRMRIIGKAIGYNPKEFLP